MLMRPPATNRVSQWRGRAAVTTESGAPMAGVILT